ncbi:TIGR03826 family flagellar region protein [Bacillus sp. JCM 19034]|uniref:TIGR03826 family flagellar region protein n=1 Tax=Bacillus sp. JCM 19034 TaxID=1481928 RepID=UPI00078206B3|nr:TIGR03826 family flagellar region protein [Bacillus sp. JCM 19034]
MKDVMNCPKCGKIFVKAFRPICPNCYREEEAHYEKVSTFLRKKQNRMASVQEVHAKTDVPLELIHQFVREGRIMRSQFPNLGYPCESCGTTIQQGRVCNNCRDHISSGLEEIERDQQLKEKIRDNEQERIYTYTTLQDRINKKD